MLKQLGEKIGDVPPAQRAAAVKDALDQVKAADPDWAYTSGPTEGGGTLFTGDLRGAIHVDAVGEVVYSGKPHPLNVDVLIALLKGDTKEAVKLGAKSWTGSKPAPVAAEPAAPAPGSPTPTVRGRFRDVGDLSISAGAGSQAGQRPPDPNQKGVIVWSW